MRIAWKLKVRKTYAKKSKVHVQHENCNRCSHASFARMHLVQPHNRFSRFANLKKLRPYGKT